MQEPSSKGGPIGVKAFLDAARAGDFGLLLGNEADAWWNFVLEHIQLGTNQLMLRIEFQDPALGPWCFWFVYEVVDRSDNSIALLSFMHPSDENSPEPSLVVPEGYEQVPYYAYRWPTLRTAF
jgi:hypothetical protein